MKRSTVLLVMGLMAMAVSSFLLNLVLALIGLGFVLAAIVAQAIEDMEVKVDRLTDITTQSVEFDTALGKALVDLRKAIADLTDEYRLAQEQSNAGKFSPFLPRH
jgi:hypothetical protein